MKTECDKCGSCCHIPHIPVGFDEKVPRSMTMPCCEVERRMRRRLTAEGSMACVALGKDHLCKIYDSRPKVCRRFRPGCGSCAKGRTRTV
jgi:Fe-S-cluster containining protein